MATLRLTIEYDGTRYSGWQEQRNARTVAGDLHGALERAGLRVAALGGAGRTDAGVHALRQVAHVQCERGAPVPDPFELQRRVNDLLPADIHLLAVGYAPEGFHARHDAASRTYLYQVALRRTAFAKKYAWWIKRPVDPAAAGAAAELLRGRHDFALFCEEPDSHPSTVVVVHAAECGLDGALLLVRLTASHFLRKMVRRVVGAIVRVGTGELPLAVFADALAGYEPDPRFGTIAAWTAPAAGLFLESVAYGDDDAPAPLAAAFPVPAAPGPALLPATARHKVRRRGPRRG